MGKILIMRFEGKKQNKTRKTGHVALLLRGESGTFRNKTFPLWWPCVVTPTNKQGIATD